MRDAMSVGCSSDGGNPRVTSRLRKVPGACTKKCAVLATVTQHICRKVEMIAHQLLRLLQDICKQNASSLYATCGLLLALQ